MSKLAVIIPVYKNDKLGFLERAVESIQSQDYKDYQLFISVDGPIKQDMAGYLEKIKSPELEIIYYKENRGLAAVLNSAIKECKDKGFEFIVRMDADDISHPERLKKQIDFLENNPEVSALGTQAFIIDKNENVIGKKNAKPKLNYKILRRQSDIIHPSVIFRKSFFDLVGYYNECVARAEDYDLWFRAARKKLDIRSISDRLLYFRFDDNIIERRKMAQKDILKVKLKYLKVYDYIYLLSHVLVIIMPKFLVKFILFRKIKTGA